MAATSQVCTSNQTINSTQHQKRLKPPSLTLNEAGERSKLSQNEKLKSFPTSLHGNGVLSRSSESMTNTSSSHLTKALARASSNENSTLEEQSANTLATNETTDRSRQRQLSTFSAYFTTAFVSSSFDSTTGLTQTKPILQSQSQSQSVSSSNTP